MSAGEDEVTRLEVTPYNITQAMIDRWQAERASIPEQLREARADERRKVCRELRVLAGDALIAAIDRTEAGT